MAERRRGPVKPPTLDLTARPAEPMQPYAAPRPDVDEGQAASADEAGSTDNVRADADTDAAPDVVRQETDEHMAGTSDAAPAPDAHQDEPAPSAYSVEPERPEDVRKESQQHTPPEPPRAAPAAPASATGPFWLSAGTGAILGVGLSLLLSTFGLWPDRPGQDPRLDQIETRLVGLESSQSGQDLAGIDQRLGSLEARVDEDVAALRATLDANGAALNALQDAPIAPGTDLSGIESELAALSSRIDALAAGVSSPDAAALTGNIDAIRADATGLGQRLDTVDTRVNDTNGALGALAARIDELQSELARVTAPPDQLTINAALKLPLLLEGLQTAFDTGRPFASELRSLGSVAPGVPVPPELAILADAGLLRPETLRDRFTAAFPAILAARPMAPDAPWYESAWDRTRAFLALRPAGEMAGDDPEAIASRLEAAMMRGDFAAARDAFATLPEPMRQAAGELPQAVAAQALASEFVANLRAQALATSNTQ